MLVQDVRAMEYFTNKAEQPPSYDQCCRLHPLPSAPPIEQESDMASIFTSKHRNTSMSSAGRVGSESVDPPSYDDSVFDSSQSETDFEMHSEGPASRRSSNESTCSTTLTRRTSRGSYKRTKSTWHMEVRKEGKERRYRFGKGWKAVLVAGTVVLFPVVLAAGVVLLVSKLVVDHVMD